MKFHYSIDVINISDVDNETILLSMEFAYGKNKTTYTIYFIRHKTGKKLLLLPLLDNYLSSFHKWQDLPINLKKANFCPLW